MTSLIIPTGWLIPRKRPGEWIFKCSINLTDLVKTHRAASYFRRLVTLLEHDYQIVDYHLKLRHNYKRNNELDVLIYFGDPNRTSSPSLTSVCISCEPTHELSIASLLSEQQYTRAWLDARARPKLILTPTRHVEGLSELIDENGEMEAFWHDAVELVNREGDQLEKDYPTMILNHGTYRNHVHLHLKINFTDNIWNTIIAPRYQEKIKEIKQLLQKPNVVNDCFKKNPSKKTRHRQISRKNADSSK
jgi:diadenosine tetraphosphate (Ap4A) HIT family hydrolase